MRNTLVAVCAAMAMSGITAGAAFAAENPAETGQPGTAQLGSAGGCGAAGRTAMPNGFNTAGFANAGLRYAGSADNPNASGNTHAVAEYDIACYQQTASH